MPKTATIELKPRKTPVQARSSASVEAICEAAIQVLLAVGKERLTTTRVAERAGVSVGTLYQYFPNKSALLQAVLRAHLDNVYDAVAAACESAKGRPLGAMADALVESFLTAKMKHEATSRALYYISDDVGGAEIARANAARGAKIVAAMLATAREPLREDPQIIAATVMAAMSGVSRRMIESENSPKKMQAMRQELGVMVQAYLRSCADK